MVIDGDVLTKNKVKELLRNSTEPKAPKGKRRGRETFFVANIAIVALVALTAISYRPSLSVDRGIDLTQRAEDGDSTFARDAESSTVIRYPLTTAVKVILPAGDEVYFEYRTAAMLGALKMTKEEVVQ